MFWSWSFPFSKREIQIQSLSGLITRADILFYLHCVRFAWGSLAIGKYCPIVAFQNIYMHQDGGKMNC